MVWGEKLSSFAHTQTPQLLKAALMYKAKVQDILKSQEPVIFIIIFLSDRRSGRDRLGASMFMVVQKIATS